MVFNIRNMVAPTVQKIDQPILNEFSEYSFDDMMRLIAKRIMSQIKSTPELLGMIDTLITDHFMGDVDFYDNDGRELGPTNFKKAQRQWHEFKVYQAFYGQAFDYFTDGNGFGWVGSPMDNLSSKQKESLRSLNSSFKASSLGNVRNAINSALIEPKKISYISASTTEILHNEYGIFGYKQDASGKIVIWNPDQIVHTRLMNIDGKTRGYSGIKALAKEVALIYMVKENMIAKLSNGGSADNIISLKNASGTSRSRFERLRKALESFSHLKKSHGNMPIDAEVTVQSLGTSLKDMEYRELAMFVISEFALGLGLPISRVPFMMTGSGGTSNKGELSGNSEDAYQKKVNNRRTQWESGWNVQFNKLGWSFKFRRDNLQDETRETQASTQRAAYMSQVQAGLRARGKQLRLQSHLALLSGKKMNINEDDVEDMSPEEIAMQNPIMGNPAGNPMQNQTQSNDEMKSKVNNDRIESKKKNAKNGDE